MAYSHSAGFQSYREGLANYYKNIGLNVTHQNILVTTGGSEAITMSLNSIMDQGDEIIIPEPFYANYNGFSTAAGVKVKPISSSINSGFSLPEISEFEKLITPKTKAIMLAHALGNPFNVGRVKEICDKHNLWLIEDTCDALGAEYNGQKCGTFGDIGTLSFYPAHHMTMGEGGAVFMNDPQLKVIAESFRDWGRDCYCPPGCDNTCGCRFEQKHGDLPFGYDHKYVYSHSGYNLKITDMQAACGLAQLGKLEFFIEKRRSNYTYLRNKLESLTDFIHLPVLPYPIVKVPNIKIE